MLHFFEINKTERLFELEISHFEDSKIVIDVFAPASTQKVAKIFFNDVSEFNCSNQVQAKFIYSTRLIPNSLKTLNKKKGNTVFYLMKDIDDLENVIVARSIQVRHHSDHIIDNGGNISES